MVLAIAVPAFVRELETSKATEASELLATLMERSAAYYAVARPTPGGFSAHCLPASAGPTPYAPSADPIPVDFGAPDSPATATWQALGFAPHRPLRYRYSFTVRGPSCVRRGEAVVPVPQLILRAEGDLDSDGSLSRFERRAKLRDNGLLEPERLLRVTDRIE